MSIILRREEPGDYREVERLTREAFWDVYRPGCDEHLLAHNLRKADAFLPELDFVAVEDGRIVGNIMYSRSRVVEPGGRERGTITFGPVSVLPSRQREGIGSRLIRHTLDLARGLGHGAVIIFGSPDYYHRFGFTDAASFGIATADGRSFKEFMAMELYEGALRGVSGRYRDDPVFQVNEKELVEFEKGFPYREKHVTDTQLR